MSRRRFCNVRQIQSYSNTVFSALAAEKYLLNLEATAFAKRLAHYLSEINADRTLHLLKATAIGIHVVVREVKHLGESGPVSCVPGAGRQRQKKYRQKPGELLQQQHHSAREIFEANVAHRNFRFGYARLKLEAVCLGNTARSQELIGAIQFDHCLCKGL